MVVLNLAVIAAVASLSRRSQKAFADGSLPAMRLSRRLMLAFGLPIPETSMTSTMRRVAFRIRLRFSCALLIIFGEILVSFWIVRRNYRADLDWIRQIEQSRRFGTYRSIKSGSDEVYCPRDPR